ncbi:unnamed protein product [Rotaria sp. Silwood2]|nr:unnamed protein product [Rotaria sp. Silwood2]
MSTTDKVDEVVPPQLDNLLELDPYIKPYAGEIKRRYKVYRAILDQLNTEENGIDVFTSAYTHFGIHVDCRTNEIKIKEWAPGARALYIRGDFNNLQ